MNFTILQCLAVALAVQSFSVAIGQDETSNDIKFPVEMKSFKLTVVDEGQKPIQGVKVTALGVRCDESPGSWIGWPSANAGNNEYLTDENGFIEMKYPVKFGAPGQWMTLNKIDFQFKHSDYVANRFEVDPSQAKAEHGLVRGCRTLFTCVDENGASIKEFGVLMAGTGAEAQWKLASGEKDNGEYGANQGIEFPANLSKRS